MCIFKNFFLHKVHTIGQQIGISATVIVIIHKKTFPTMYHLLRFVPIPRFHTFCSSFFGVAVGDMRYTHKLFK